METLWVSSSFSGVTTPDAVIGWHVPPPQGLLVQGALPCPAGHTWASTPGLLVNPALPVDPRLSSCLPGSPYLPVGVGFVVEGLGVISKGKYQNSDSHRTAACVHELQCSMPHMNEIAWFLAFSA